MATGQASNILSHFAGTSAARSSLRSPHFAAKYQNVSTQYSPNESIFSQATAMSELVNREEVSIKNQKQTKAAYEGTESSSMPKIGDFRSQIQSPSTKRRQVLDQTITVSSPSESHFSTPKRPKSSKRVPKVLPRKYELCDVEDIVILIADMISELIETNDNLPLRDVVLTRFHSRTPPGISVIDYLQRLAKHAALTPPLLLSMVYYIDRLCSLYPAFTITTLTVHRFLITAATVAAKGLSDSFWNNTTYARVGGIKLAELGLLELEFLYRVDWRIVPNPEVLVDYYRGLVSRTDDYVIESDSCAGDAVDQGSTDIQTLVKSDAESLSDTKFNEHMKTDTKWEKWMRDVAHTSSSKDVSADHCDGQQSRADGEGL